jgi:hypothetical protein
MVVSRHRKLPMIAFLCLAASASQAQTSESFCSTAWLPIPETPAPAASQLISVDQASFPDQIAANVAIRVWSNHSSVEELSFALTRLGRTVVLQNAQSGINQCYGMNVLYDDAGGLLNAALLNCAEHSQLVDIVAPVEPLSGLAGLPIYGDWTLSVLDGIAGGFSGGSVTQWCLELMVDDPIGDEFEIDDTREQAGLIIMAGEPSRDDIEFNYGQVHTLHTPNDVDWTKFPGSGDEDYDIRVIPSDPLLPVDVTVWTGGDLSKGSQVIDSAAHVSCGGAVADGEPIDIQFLRPTADQTLFIEIHGCSATVAGEQFSYELQVGHAVTPGDCVLLTGSVFSALSSQPIEALVISTDDNTMSFSDNTGLWQLCTGGRIQILSSLEGLTPSPRFGPITVDVLTHFTDNCPLVEPCVIDDLVNPPDRMLNPGSALPLDLQALPTGYIFSTRFEDNEDFTSGVRN